MNNVILTRSEFKGVLIGLGILPAAMFVFGLYVGSTEGNDQFAPVIQDSILPELSQTPLVGDKANGGQPPESGWQSTNEIINEADALSLLSEVMEIQSRPVQAMLEPLMPVDVISEEPSKEVVDPPEQSFESTVQEEHAEASSLTQNIEDQNDSVETYVIQVGRFSLKENAASYIQALGQKGIHARLGYVKDSVKGYPVEVGLFGSYSEAKARAVAIKQSDKIEGFVRQSADKGASSSS